jgi:hypothetical protein
VKSHLAPFLPKALAATARTGGVGRAMVPRRPLRQRLDPADQLDVHRA